MYHQELDANWGPGSLRDGTLIPRTVSTACRRHGQRRACWIRATPMETTTPPPATADRRTLAWPDPGHVLLVDPLRASEGREGEDDGGATAYVIMQYGESREERPHIRRRFAQRTILSRSNRPRFFQDAPRDRTPARRGNGALLESKAAARGVAFILEWQVARVAGLGRRGRAEAQRRQAGPGRRATCRGSGGRLDGTAAAPPWIGGPPDRQDLPAS